MRAKLLHESDGRRSFAIALERGEELMTALAGFARAEDVGAAELTAIGALESATLAYFDVETREYEEIEVAEQVELLALNGRVTLHEDADPGDPGAERRIHVHCVLGRRDGSTVGGHVLAATVRPTCEVFLTAYPARLGRRVDPDSGLPVLDLGSGA